MISLLLKREAAITACDLWIKSVPLFMPIDINYRCVFCLTTGFFKSTSNSYKVNQETGPLLL